MESPHSDGKKLVRAPIPKELDELGRVIVDGAFRVHKELGPGLLESVYEICLLHELKKRALTVQRQVELPVRYDNVTIDAGFRLDLVVA